MHTYTFNRSSHPASTRLLALLLLGGLLPACGDAGDAEPEGSQEGEGATEPLDQGPPCVDDAPLTEEDYAVIRAVIRSGHDSSYTADHDTYILDTTEGLGGDNRYLLNELLLRNEDVLLSHLKINNPGNGHCTLASDQNMPFRHIIIDHSDPSINSNCSIDKITSCSTILRFTKPGYDDDMSRAVILSSASNEIEEMSTGLYAYLLLETDSGWQVQDRFDVE